jgi:hypothetical protein
MPRWQSAMSVGHWVVKDKDAIANIAKRLRLKTFKRRLVETNEAAPFGRLLSFAPMYVPERMVDRTELPASPRSQSGIIKANVLYHSLLGHKSMANPNRVYAFGSVG